MPISYDAIGNPLNDGTWTYTWQNGRQLAGMSKDSTTVSFKYNVSGLRTRKIVNGTVTNYTLRGKNVVHMTQGSNNLHFFYDAQNRPAVVVYNGTAYAYVKNLQGDIIAILDSAGTAVVSYTYDAWGAPTSTTGTMAATLGVLNPFRYRGYVYDEETELYYLRSRYYKPIWYRFVNADSELVYKTNKYICHQYAYCSNSPIVFVDPDGYEENVFDEEDGNITNDKVGKPLSSANPLATTSTNSRPGRAGGAAHKLWVKQTVELLKTMYPGAKVKPEAKVVSKNGQIRYGDVGVYFPGSRSPYLVAQVGKSLMSGNPVARERRAITDITSSGVYVLYFSYDRNGPAMFYHP